MVLVLDGRAGENNVVLQKYTWGLDLSGLDGGGGRAAGFSPRGPSVGASVTAIHGAGGIGGLLATENVAAGGESSNSYWYLYDGNGNVGQLLKASDRTTSAKYEYDAYGNSLVASGTYANTNPFRFSTKWRDTSNSYNWYYYGYRYYSPRLGRWINRDPLLERGGVNVYQFVRNGCTMGIDSLGLVFGCCRSEPSPPSPAPRDPGRCCSDARASGLKYGDSGGVICCDGNKVACAWYDPVTNPSANVAIAIAISCTTEHEKTHFDDTVACPKDCPSLSRPPYKWSVNQNESECKAWEQSVKCLEANREACKYAPRPKECQDLVDSMVREAKEDRDFYCGLVEWEW